MKLAEEFANADEVIDLNKYPNPEKIFMSLTEEGKGLMLRLSAWASFDLGKNVFTGATGGTVHFFGGCKSGSAVTFDTTEIHYRHKID